MSSLERLRGSPLVTFNAAEPFDAATLVLEPHFGTIEWTPPKSYADVLSQGAFTIVREHNGMKVDVTMLSGDEFTGVNQDLVHMPEGVSIDDGVYLSTNHLVGFATSGGEGVWCFDVTQPNLPVYYHHQDQPRARVLETGKWSDEEHATPVFPSFDAWLEAMTNAFTAEKAPSWFDDLGSPYVNIN